MNRALCVIQWLLAAIFLFAGGAKLILPVEEMTRQLPLSGAFLRFIGVAEVLGAAGLVLPGLLHIRPRLTPLAAGGLAVIMIGATTVTLKLGVVQALIPLAVGILAAFVAYGRGRRSSPVGQKLG
jgi:DoxX-like family